MADTTDLVIRTPTFSDFEAAEDTINHIEVDSLLVQHQSPSKPIPAHIWEVHRPVIEKLYIDNGLKLSEVRDLMKRHYGFIAA